jgi:hypothetical protein
VIRQLHQEKARIRVTVSEQFAVMSPSPGFIDRLIKFPP